MSEVGFKNPNRDFDVVAKEFTIPAKVFLMDSISTSTGLIENSTRGKFAMPDPQRMLVGSINDPHFGKSTAVGYTVYTPASGYAKTSDDAVYDGLNLTMVFDYYWIGSQTASTQEFEVYELTDSVLTYLQHYTSQSTPYGKLLGKTTFPVNPAGFDSKLADNNDGDPNNNILDSLQIKMDDDLGRALFAKAMDTVGYAEYDFVTFRKFRHEFKGIAVTSPNSDKIVGFYIENAKSRLTLKYHIDTVKYEYNFAFVPPEQAASTGEFMAYTQITTDRSGTPLAGLTSKYADFEPADGNRYVQAGTGVGLKLDFSEVYDHFKNLQSKALSVAELKITGETQATSPFSFKLRALRPNNRELKSSKTYQDAANDPYEDYDVDFVAKHLLVSRTLQRPYLRADITGDLGTEFSVSKRTSTTGTMYAGYLTSFLQQELSLSETDFLRYYALFPQTPDNARGLNGFYFPADNIKLTIYYTTPRAAN